MQPLGQRGYSEEDVKNALHAKNGTRPPLEFRYMLMNADNEPLRDISDQVLGGSIDHDSLADIKRTATFTIQESGEQTINYLSDRIQPAIRMRMPRVNKTYEDVWGQIGNPLLRYRMDEAPGATAAVNSAPTGSAYNGTFHNVSAQVTQQGSHNGGEMGVANTTHPINLPAGFQAGEMLVVAFSVYSTPTITFPAGWNVIGPVSNDGFVTSAIMWKIAVGGEDPDILTNTARKSTHLSLRLKNAVSLEGSAVGSATGSPNPPSVTASAEATMWLRVHSGEGPNKATNIPTPHTNWYQEATVDEDSASTDLVTYVLRATTNDPGAFTSGVGATVGWNLAVIGTQTQEIPGHGSLLATGASYEFHEANESSVETTGTGALLTGLDAFSFTLWFSLAGSSASSFEWLFDTSETASVNNGITAFLGDSGVPGVKYFGVVFQTTDGYVECRSPFGTFTDGQLYSVSFTWEAGELPECWLNGEQVELTHNISWASLPSSQTVTGTLTSPNDLTIARRQNAVALDSLNGRMAELSFFGARMTAQQARDLYNAGLAQGKFAPKGQNFVEWPQGVFLLTTPTRKADEFGSVVREVEAYDQGLVLRDNAYTNRHYVAAGTSYVEALESVLAGMNHRITWTDLELPVDREWEPGTTRLQVANDLLAAINYESVWFDENGVAVCRPYEPPQDRQPEYTYADDQLSVIVPDLEDTTDLYAVPNKWVFVASSPDTAATWRVELTNEDVNSPTSYQSRGSRYIVRYETGVEVATEPELEAFAYNQALTDSQVYNVVTMTTALMPHHTHNNVLLVRYLDLDTEAVFSETSWSLELDALALMNHSVRRAIQTVITLEEA